MQQAAKSPEIRRSTESLPMSLRVGNAMHKLGVSGLPRNYELFYAAITGANEHMKNELWGLGNNLSQASLDDLYQKHCARPDDEVLVQKICETLDSKMSETMELMREELQVVTNYGRVLGEASERLDSAVRMPPEMMGKLIGLLSNATKSTKEKGQRTLEEIRGQSSQIENMRNELETYKKLSETDALTGLFNRRAFDSKLARLTPSALKNTAFVMGDIDKFKNINDTYSHPFGDYVIRTIAGIIQKNCREGTMVARLGGEEFALLGENTNPHGMLKLAERVRIAVAETSFSDGKVALAPGQVTISFGACHSSAVKDCNELYARADEALYASKRNGRNRVTPYVADMDGPDRKNLFMYRN